MHSALFCLPLYPKTPGSRTAYTARLNDGGDTCSFKITAIKYKKWWRNAWLHVAVRKWHHTAIETLYVGHRIYQLSTRSGTLFRSKLLSREQLGWRMGLNMKSCLSLVASEYDLSVSVRYFPSPPLLSAALDTQVPPAHYHEYLDFTGLKSGRLECRATPQSKATLFHVDRNLPELNGP